MTAGQAGNPVKAFRSTATFRRRHGPLRRRHAKPVGHAGRIKPFADGAVFLASGVVEFPPLNMDRLAGNEVVAAAMADMQIRPLAKAHSATGEADIVAPTPRRGKRLAPMRGGGGTHRRDRRRFAHRAGARGAPGAQGSSACRRAPPGCRPTGHLRPPAAEPVADRRSGSPAAPDAVPAGRRRTPGRDRAPIAANTGFHWRPEPGAPKRPAGSGIGRLAA